jgi:hypothetical protein
MHVNSRPSIIFLDARSSFLGRTVPTRFPGVFRVIARLEKTFSVQNHFQLRIFSMLPVASISVNPETGANR